MSIKTHIIGNEGDHDLELAVKRKYGVNAIVAFTEPYLDKAQSTVFAFNAENGIEMNKDAAFSGTPQLVHDGTDAVGWTGSSVSGSRITFDSTAQAHSGTKSVYMNRPVVGEVWEFDKGSSFGPTAYVALTLWIYVDNNWATDDETVIYAYDSGSALQIGDQVDLRNYFEFSNFDVWQQLTIPITDFNVSSTAFDTLRMEVLSSQGTRPRWYLDDMDWQEAGGAVVYKIEPPKGKIFTVDKVQLTFIDAYAGTLADNSVKNLSWDQILAETKLTNGITLQRVEQGKVEFSANVTCLADFIKDGGLLDEMFSDGTDTLLRGSVNFSHPVELDPRTLDSISITISDDLSGFLSFTAIGRGNTRDIIK